MHKWINGKERLLYPMKRIGKRGSGEFKRISWDEAIDTIADALRYTIDTYGNDAIYKNYATGDCGTTGDPSARLLGMDLSREKGATVSVKKGATYKLKLTAPKA